MNLTLIAHLSAVARTGSFIAAARELNVTPSVVTRAIQKLEEHVGVALFERTTRQVSLTPAGRAFLAGAEEGVARLSTATENARRFDQRLPRLRLGLCPSSEPALSQVASGLRRLTKAHPKITVQVQSVPRKLQREALWAGEIDIGIMRPSDADCSGLETHVIASHPLAVFLPDIWSQEGATIRLEALKDRPWILPDPEIAPDSYRRHVGLCHRAGFEPKVGALLSGTGDWYSGRALVASGVGAALGAWLDPPGPLMRAFVLEDMSSDTQAQTAVVWTPGAASQYRDELLNLLAI